MAAGRTLSAEGKPLKLEVDYFKTWYGKLSCA
jgi:hypothetical protein